MATRMYGLFLLWVAMNCVLAQTYQEFDGLLSHLFDRTRYNRKMRPLLNQSRNMEVNLTQVVTALESLDLSSGILEIYSYFELTWYDELLVWNPEEYAGLRGMTLPRDMFWRPELVTVHMISNEECNVVEGDFTTSYVTNQGLVMMFSAGKFEATCDIGVRQYPFDRHECSFPMVIVNHVYSELKLHQLHDSPRIHSEFTQHEEWILEDLQGVYINTTDGSSMIAVPTLHNVFYLKRKPAYEVLKTFIPLQLLILTCVATFFIPPDCGERISYTVTLYLAILFTSSTVMDYLPRNSDQLALPTITMPILNVFGALVVFWSIFVVSVARRPYYNMYMPSILRRLFINSKNNTSTKFNTISETTDESLNLNTVTALNDVNSGHTGDVDDNVNTKDDILLGIDVARYLDKVCFISTSIVLLCLGGFFYIIKSLGAM